MTTDAITHLRDFLGRHGEGVLAGALTRVLSLEGPARTEALEALCPRLSRLTLSPANGHGVQVCAIDGTNRKLAALRGALCK